MRNNPAEQELTLGLTFGFVPMDLHNVHVTVTEHFSYGACN